MTAETKPTSTVRSKWNYHPDLPISHSAAFSWPLQPRGALVSLTKRWVTLSGATLSFACALGYYAYLLPDNDTLKTLSFGWVSMMWISNLVVFTLFAGSLHLHLYTFTMQGQRLKFDARNLARDRRGFAFRNQVLDNMFWSLAGGASAWTFFEVLY